MKRYSLVMVAILSLCLSGVTQANVFNLGQGLTNLEMVTVGDPGNAPYGYMRDGLECGTVAYTYSIGKYEVTAAQYCDFLNHKAKSDQYGLYNSHMDTDIDQSGCNIKRSGSDGSYSYSVASDWANRPVNYVNFWDAARFSNWLNNGQGDGNTETGAYTLNSYNSNDGREIQRNSNANYFLPNVNEWHKAAYYKGGGLNAGYWTYATQSDEAPSNNLVNPTDPGNNATIFLLAAGDLEDYTLGSPYYRSEVGAHENSESAYGTFDQAGNVWETTDTSSYFYDWELGLSIYSRRYIAGGSYKEYPYFGTAYINSLNSDPSTEWSDSGFRVASSIVPEPSSILAMLGGLGLLLAFRRRRA